MCMVCASKSQIIDYSLFNSQSIGRFDHVSQFEAAQFGDPLSSGTNNNFATNSFDPFLISLQGPETPGSSFLNADQRGENSPNDKPSLDVNGAGAQLVRFGAFWGGGEGVTVTYGFRSTAPSSMPSDTSGFSRFNPTQIIQAERAIQAWEDVANINFQRVGEGISGSAAYTNNATILFSNYSSGRDGAAAFAFFPGSTSSGSSSGDSWYNSGLSYNANPALGNYGRLTLAHEIGHAIGLAHPGDYNADPNVQLSYAQDAEYYEDSSQYTVMSYWNETNTGAQFFNNFAGAPLMDDISAAQRLYGVNTTTRSGDDIYGFNSNTNRDFYIASSPSDELIFSVWDAGGHDIFDFSGFADDQLINLTAGSFSNVGGLTGNVSIAPDVIIEEAIGGSGNDTVLAGDGTISRSFADSYDDIPASGGTIFKSQAQSISQFNSALSIDGTFNLQANNDIENATSIPHTTVRGTGGGNVDIYEFTIDEVISATFDMDSTTQSFDPYLYLYNSDLDLIAFNDDSPIDAGSNKTQDSFLEYTFQSTGTYYLLVNRWDPDGFGPGIPFGAAYSLHISFERAPDLVIDGYLGYTLTGGGGNDLLISGIGADLMTGGDGSDVFQIDNLHGADTITDFQPGIDTVDLSSLAEEVLLTDGRSGRMFVFDEVITLQQVGDDTILAYEKQGKVQTYDLSDALIIFENLDVNDISLSADFLL